MELAGCGQYVLEFFTTQIEKADGDLDLLTAVSPLCLSVSLSLSHVCPTLSDSPSHPRTLKMEAANKRLTPIQLIPTPPPPHTHTHQAMDAANKEVDPQDEEAKGGSAEVAKMLLSSGATQLALHCYVPASKAAKCNASSCCFYFIFLSISYTHGRTCTCLMLDTHVMHSWIRTLRIHSCLSSLSVSQQDCSCSCALLDMQSIKLVITP